MGNVGELKFDILLPKDKYMTILNSLKGYFSKKRNVNNSDELSVSLQNEIIRLAEEKLEKTLSNEIKYNIRNRGWGYMGLEGILDYVKYLEGEELENYLQNLK